MLSEEDIANRFKFHPADTDKKAEAHERVWTLCLITANALNELIPEGREKALAFTKLEEVMFWSNAALARHHA
jgi:hypothetical protein